MTEEKEKQQITQEIKDGQRVAEPKKPQKAKRDIFCFNGERPTGINLEHVTHMSIEGKKITFNFYSTAIFIELADESAAASMFEILLKSWSGDVLE